VFNISNRDSISRLGAAWKEKKSSANLADKLIRAVAIIIIYHATTGAARQESKLILWQFMTSFFASVCASKKIDPRDINYSGQGDRFCR
jgi:hypothetical protein